VYNYVKYNKNTPKVCSHQYSVQKLGKNPDVSEKWYKKALIHDLDDKSPSFHLMFVLPALWYKPCVDTFIFSSIYIICQMPSILMNKQPTKNWATKELKNGGQGI
jgi:hypothetical protein